MNLEWMAIRGSGLMAYMLLAGAVIWGLMVSTKVLGSLKAKQVTWFHESLSIGALLATVVHMVALYNDDFIEFTLRDLLVPGAATWRPTAVAFGVVAFYSLLIITASFYLKKVIGQAAWRGLHYSAFGTFVVALLHGVQAGTDSSNSWVRSMYVATGAIVFMLILVRFVQASTPERTSRAGTPTARTLRTPRPQATLPPAPPEAPSPNQAGPAERPGEGDPWAGRNRQTV